MASPILIFPFQEYWSQLREGTRDQIIGGIIVLIVSAIGGATWRILRRRAAPLVDPQPASVQPTQQEVVVKFEGVQTVSSPASLPEPIATSKRSPIPRPPLAGFVARRDENGRDIVERLKEELLPEKEQLIVLWGAGGVGKTTLAAETARAMRAVFVGGIVWTTADGKPDFALSTLLDEIATQLGRPDLRQLAPEPKDEAVHQLLSTAPAALIVLDNFETISPTEQEKCAQWLADRASCPALITSRDQVIHARPVRILAMSLPEAREFLKRLITELGNPQAFKNLDPEKIIQAADRIPRVLQWVVRQIDSARQPQTVLDELAQGAGDAAERVFDRSFDLPQLGDDGRATLLALSLFVPDASRSALAEVAGFGDDVARLDSAVQQLVELWLIQATAGNERLRVEGLTRELGRARVAREATAANYRQRFVAYFNRYAKEHEKHRTEDYIALEAERDNLLNSVDVAFELGEWETVQLLAWNIASSVGGWLTVYGYWSEGLKINQLGLNAAEQSNNRHSAAVFGHNLAILYASRGELAKARTLYTDSLRVFKELGDEISTAGALHDLGNSAYEQGEVVEARRLYSEGLEIQKRLGNKEGITTALHQLGMLAHSQSEFVEAHRLYTESLAIDKELGNLGGISATLHQLAILADEQGQRQKARELYDESLQLLRQLGDQRGIAASLHQLGTLAQDEGDFAVAEQLYNESLAIKTKLGDQSGIAVTLHNLGNVSELQGSQRQAARLYRDALEIFEKLNSPMAKKAQESLERVNPESTK
ncbi:MAG TPA: tetratricopeptide repeat protein [Pyrinomonadaceae bacterium]|nr:tetratricopeptide repeat protein [Pyrinomonadaceae bacterium]